MLEYLNVKDTCFSLCFFFASGLYERTNDTETNVIRIFHGKKLIRTRKGEKISVIVVFVDLVYTY